MIWDEQRKLKIIFRNWELPRISIFELDADPTFACRMTILFHENCFVDQKLVI